MSSLNPEQFAYRGLHQPAQGPPLHDLLHNDEMPSDIYDHPQYYAADPSNRTQLRETTNALRSVRGQPDALVNIYRAAPHGVESINHGDWVTTSPTYARGHAMQSDDPSEDWPVLTAKVPAAHVNYAGDALEEYGYFGPGVQASRL